MRKIILTLAAVIGFLTYSIVGTSYNIPKIRSIAPAEIERLGWTIIRYDGYQFGSFSKNGGVACYSVIDQRTGIRQDLAVSMWFGELQFWYQGNNLNLHSY